MQVTVEENQTRVDTFKFISNMPSNFMVTTRFDIFFCDLLTFLIQMIGLVLTAKHVDLCLHHTVETGY